MAETWQKFIRRSPTRRAADKFRRIYPPLAADKFVG